MRAPEPRVADVGELGLLSRIARWAGPVEEPVVVGIGDDTAAVRVRGDHLVLLTADALVEDVHFRRATSGPDDVGWKALAINASDIAAMGGTPTAAVISLMLPPDTEVAWVEGLYRGLREMAAAAGITLAGGNLARAPAVIVDVALLGEVASGRLVRRSGARPGDVLAVTGTLGRAAAGLIVLETRVAAQDAPADATGAGLPAEVEVLVAAHRRPRPRLAAGRALGAAGATAMLDVSDGLTLDLWRLCEASGVGVVLDADAVPVDPVAGTIARAVGRTGLDLALGGGEDYELLFTAPADAAARVLRMVEEEGGVPATVIGEVRPPAEGRRVRAAGEVRPLDPRGWTHFHEVDRAAVKEVGR